MLDENYECLKITQLILQQSYFFFGINLEIYI
jgi:hypothetical protein